MVYAIIILYNFSEVIYDKTYTKGALKGHTYDFGNLSKEKIRTLENTFASSALEGFDNPKINQYLINQLLSGFTHEECNEQVIYQIKNNLAAFLAQFN